MNEFYRLSGIFIPTKYKDEQFYKNIKSNLTREAKQYQNSPIVILKFYLENPTFLIIPRFFPIEQYTRDFTVKDVYGNGQDIDINCNITLRDELQESTVFWFANFKRGIVQAAPGSGKTVVAIKMIAEKRKKTFILVHRDSLVDQWKERLLQYTDLDETEIVKLTTAKFFKNVEAPIIISTNQTFASIINKYGSAKVVDTMKNANIGIFIGDEVHTTVGAPTFSQCSIHVPAKYVYGLSATPYRYDGNSDIIEYHLGPVFTPSGKASTMGAKVTVILMSFGVIKGRERYINWGGYFQRARYLNMLKNSKVLIDLSLSLISRFEKDQRQIIFVNERIKFIETLYSMISSTDKSKFIGSEKNEVLNKQITFATPGKVRDGVDCPQKDCIILTSPITNIEQMCGRIVRIKEGKSQPIVIDIVDIDTTRISGSLFKRLDYYEARKWDVQFLHFDPLSSVKFRTIDKGEAFNIIKNKEGDV